jgi:amino acid transporter
MCCPLYWARFIRTRRTPYIAIAFTTLLAFGLIAFVGRVPALGGTTALLLLCVFTVVNVAVLVLRKDKVGHEHLQSADDSAGDWRRLLRVPCWAMDRSCGGAI